MIETYNTKASGDKITASSVNIIQDGLDQIVSTWGTASAGSARASVGGKCNASLINNWIAWLKTYASRIGATSVTNSLSNVSVGSKMSYSTIPTIYNATQSVKNWCNRSECNKSECNSSECNSGECNSVGEGVSGECNGGGER